MSDDSVCFKDCIHIWAYSKPARGESYLLNDDLYDELVQAVRFASNMVDDAIAFVQQAGADGLTSQKLMNSDGKPTGLGLIAQHFNLMKTLKYEGPDDYFVRGVWSVTPHAKRVADQDSSVKMLYDTVLKCLQLTSQGLRGGVKFRGIDPGEEAGRKTYGKVTARRGGMARTINGQRVDDKFHPDKTFVEKKWLLGKAVTNTYMPSLTDDRIFLAADAKLLGAIHVDYTLINGWRGITTGLLNEDATLSWTIVHEATHKFARTRDVNTAYTIAECSHLHWHSALRNASHYERFVGLDWSKALGRERFGVAELLRQP